MAEDEPVCAGAEDACEDDQGGFVWEAEVRLEEVGDAGCHGWYICVLDFEFWGQQMSERYRLVG